MPDQLPFVDKALWLTENKAGKFCPKATQIWELREKAYREVKWQKPWRCSV